MSNVISSVFRGVRREATAIMLMVADVQSYYQKVEAFAEVVGPLSPRSWGLQDFRIINPFGYYLRVTSLHNVPENLETL